MPNARLYPVAARHARQSSALGPPAGRLFGLSLGALGLLALALNSAPLLVAGAQSAPTPAAFSDPGVRHGPVGAGGPVEGLTSSEETFFTTTATDIFKEIDSVSGTEPGAAGIGLGPRFNMNSCAGCHAQPAVGGSSPLENPQVKVATDYGAQNYVPWFINKDGPVREVRFIHNPDGSPDGGVHDLFTINGRTDAKGCNITQGSFSDRDNIIFRIPTPTFGAGLIEAIPDSTIIKNKSDNAVNNALRGISGHENREGNTGTVTRFGWKAQNKSLVLFAGEAYNVEQGVTNEIFPNERDETAGCQFNDRPVNGIPEDHTAIGANGTQITETASDVVQFGMFMRFLAPPTPAPPNQSILSGRQVFNQIGCAMCHTPSMQTGKAANMALDHKTVNLYSDLLVHNMGTNLADGISQGNAGGNEFRTAPLWGLGQRIFFLHDGRTKDLVAAIQAHSSNGSEATTVVGYFNSLPAPQKQDLLNFLRSL